MSATLLCLHFFVVLLALIFTQFTLSSSIDGIIDLTTDNGWSKIGNTFCVGYTNDQTSSSGTLKIHLEIIDNTTYNENISYSLILYDQKSYKTLNISLETISCDNKIDEYSVSHSFDFNDSLNYTLEQSIYQSYVHQNWRAYIANCEHLPYPIIEYNMEYTSSMRAIDDENCNSSSNGGNDDDSNPIIIILVVCGLGVLCMIGIIIGWNVWWRKKKSLAFHDMQMHETIQKSSKKQLGVGNEEHKQSLLDMTIDMDDEQLADNDFKDNVTLVDENADNDDVGDEVVNVGNAEILLINDFHDESKDIGENEKTLVFSSPPQLSDRL